MNTIGESKALSAVHPQLFIGGEWRDAEGGKTFGVEDPSTGTILMDVADASVADGLAALDAAVGKQAEWAGTAPRERGEVLRRAYEAIMDQLEELTLLMTLEMGKPLKESRSEVAYAAEFCRWFSEEAVRINGRYAVSPDGATRLLTMKQPVGPCLMITPWNFPLAMGTRKIGPAVAAGCTMVVKPAALTPLSMLRLADIMVDAGLPGGVLNVITTKSTGKVMEPIIKDPRLRKLTFTGSTDVGRTLIEQSAQGVLRVSMELGGNAPFLVFDDADLDKAVDGAVAAKMRNNGEACTAANRFIVHDSVAAEFSKRLTDRLGALSVGRGADDSIDVGPLVEEKHRDKVAALVTDAVEKGAKVLTGGYVPEREGYYYPPTVLTDIPSDAHIVTEEIFGPVAAVYTFSDEAEALRLANDTEYGLIGYVFTENHSRAIRMSEGLDTGIVGVNQGVVSNPAAPFGGVKASGYGREGGLEGIEDYLATKYVGIAL